MGELARLAFLCFGVAAGCSFPRRRGWRFPLCNAVRLQAPPRVTIALGAYLYAWGSLYKPTCGANAHGLLSAPWSLSRSCRPQPCCGPIAAQCVLLSGSAASLLEAPSLVPQLMAGAGMNSERLEFHAAVGAWEVILRAKVRPWLRMVMRFDMGAHAPITWVER